MKKTLFLALVLSSLVPVPALAVVSTGTIEKTIISGSTDLPFRAATYASDGEGIVISSDGTSSGASVDLSKMNLYFNKDGLISGIKADGADSPTNGAGSTNTAFAWVVADGRLILDGVTGTDGCFIDLKQNLSIGTEFNHYDSAELVIQNGSKVATTAFYNAVGSNGTKGIITVSGQGTELKTQQITFGAAGTGLQAYSGDYSYTDATTGDTLSYWRPLYLDASIRDEIINNNANFIKGYGILNIEEGAKVTIGEGNAGYWNSRLQLFNGEVNVSGSGSELVMADGTHLSMDAHYGKGFTADEYVCSGYSVKGFDRTIDYLFYGTAFTDCL